MTEPDDMLPGLAPPAPGESRLERAARTSIEQLTALGALADRDAWLAQVLLDLSAVSSTAVRTGKASAAAMAINTAIQAWDRMQPAEGGDEARDAWDELAAELRRAAAVRDPAEPRPAD